MPLSVRVVLLGVCSGFAGALLATWLILDRSAGASADPLALPRIITAEEFRLAALDGTIRATFGLLPDGQPGLSLVDRSRAIRVNLLLRGDDRPHLALLDGAGQTMVSLSSLDDGRTVLAFELPNGQKVIFPDDVRTPGVPGKR